MNAAASVQLRKEKAYNGLGCPGSRQDERGSCRFTPVLWAWGCRQQHPPGCYRQGEMEEQPS